MPLNWYNKRKSRREIFSFFLFFFFWESRRERELNMGGKRERERERERENECILMRNPTYWSLERLYIYTYRYINAKITPFWTPRKNFENNYVGKLINPKTLEVFISTHSTIKKMEMLFTIFSQQILNGKLLQIIISRQKAISVLCSI